jgi:hypothetical protein
MPRELRWGVIASVALLLGALGAVPYARLLLPYYSAVIDYLLQEDPASCAGPARLLIERASNGAP